MEITGNENKVLWNEGVVEPCFPQLIDNIEADIAIVGGGITGLTAAFLLAAEGRKVVVVEASSPGNSASVRSSAHLTTESDFSYSHIASKYNIEIMKGVALSRQFALGFIAEMADNFPCDFTYVPGFLYSEDNERYLNKEFRYASKAGLEVSFSDPQLPFPVKKAIKFPFQAVFNPARYLFGIAGHLQRLDECALYENSRVIRKENDILYTEKGSVRARTIIYATHYPLFVGMHQTLAYPFRSYMLAARIREQLNDALYWDTADPYHYFRNYHLNGEKLIVLGGADHKTGETIDGFSELETFMHKRFTVDDIGYRWSSQYYEPADGLPYIGKNFRGSEYIATGFSGDGLIYGTLAGFLISNDIFGSEPSHWKSIYDSERVRPVASAAKFTKENISVFSHMIKDRISAKKARKVVELKNGEGIVVNYNGKKLAVSRNSEGKLIQVSAVCPHLKCLVLWNKVSQTWDCPCHGSRFRPTGEVITGPATVALKRVDIKDPVRV